MDPFLRIAKTMEDRSNKQWMCGKLPLTVQFFSFYTFARTRGSARPLQWFGQGPLSGSRLRKCG
jgi:hypothetical protein